MLVQRDFFNNADLLIEYKLKWLKNQILGNSVAQLYMDVLDEILSVVVAMPHVGYKWPP